MNLGKFVRCLLCLTVLACFQAKIPAQESARTAELEKLLNEAIDLYELKQYVRAKAKLDALLAKDPTYEEAHKLRKVVGNKILGDMTIYMSKEGRDLGQAPVEILRRANLKEQELVLKPEHIQEVVTGALSGSPEKLLEIRKLGQYAVPELLKYLKNRAPQDKRINASSILVALGRDASGPLVEALETSDDLQKQNIIQVLDELRPVSRRVIAPLKEIYENENQLPIVKEWAARVLMKATGSPADKLEEAKDYYYRKANRYYLGGDDVDEEMNILNGTLWKWDSKTQELTYEKVPNFALPLLMSEEAIFDGMEIAPADERFPVILASLYIREKAMIDLTAQALTTESLLRPNAEDELKVSLMWQEHMKKNGRIAATTGADILVKVLDKALTDGKVEVASNTLNLLCKILCDKGGWSMVDNALGTGKIVAMSPAEAAKEVVEPAEVVKEGAEKEDAPQFTSNINPILQALSFPNRQIRIDAANCLARIGYPENKERYGLLLPTLIEGSEEDAAETVLIISHDPDTRKQLEDILGKKGIQVITSPSGKEGISKAVRYPFKDTILIDGSLEEFSFIRTRLGMIGLSANSPLPVTIITSPERVRDITDHFQDKEYRIEIIPNQRPDDDKMFNRLASLKSSGKQTTIAIVTNDKAETRSSIKRILEEKAQRFINPEEDSMEKMMKMAAQDGMMGTYVNVFLDHDLSGYDAMKTIIELQKDPRTSPVPVSILTNENNVNRVNDEFSEFLKNKELYSAIRSNSSTDDLVAEVRRLTKNNKLSQNKYVRIQARDTALKSAEALSLIKTADAEKETLTKAQSQRLINLLRDREDMNLRIEVAKALGHFKEESSLVTLAKIVKESNPVELRSACLKAIGQIDSKGTMHELKLHILDSDKDPAMQEAASWALSIEDKKGKTRKNDLERLRVGNIEEPAITETATEEAKPDATEEKTASEAVTEEKPAETTEAPAEEKSASDIWGAEPKEEKKETTTKKTDDEWEW